MFKKWQALIRIRRHDRIILAPYGPAAPLDMCQLFRLKSSTSSFPVLEKKSVVVDIDMCAAVTHRLHLAVTTVLIRRRVERPVPRSSRSLPQSLNFPFVYQAPSEENILQPLLVFCQAPVEYIHKYAQALHMEFTVVEHLYSVPYRQPFRGALCAGLAYATLTSSSIFKCMYLCVCILYRPLHKIIRAGCMQLAFMFVIMHVQWRRHIMASQIK